MEQYGLIYKDSFIRYYRFGEGKRVAICFHGYGEEARSFSFLGKNTGPAYTFFSIDLPFHGQTKWNEGLRFSNRDLVNIITQMLEAQFPGSPVPEKISLLGFSLGGRVALSLYQALPGRVDLLLLLATDGLKMNFWYWLTTQTWVGNKLFRWTMKHPGWFLFFIKNATRMGLTSQSISKFVLYYLQDEKVRMDLYTRWTTLRRLRPSLRKIKTLIRKYKTRVELIYGQHDRIIVPARGLKFRRSIEDFCAVSIIDSGHQVLHEKHAGEILDRLLV